MLTQDLKDRIKFRLTEDFESSMCDGGEIQDGLIDSMSAEMASFWQENQQEYDNLTVEEKDESIDFFEEVYNELCDDYNETLEEEDEEE